MAQQQSEGLGDIKWKEEKRSVTSFVSVFKTLDNLTSSGPKGDTAFL